MLLIRRRADGKFWTHPDYHTFHRGPWENRREHFWTDDPSKCRLYKNPAGAKTSMNQDTYVGWEERQTLTKGCCQLPPRFFSCPAHRKSFKEIQEARFYKLYELVPVQVYLRMPGASESGPINPPSPSAVSPQDTVNGKGLINTTLS